MQSKLIMRIMLTLLFTSTVMLAFKIGGGYVLAGSIWHIETVDSDGDVGYITSIALDSSNHPHISYCDLTGANRDLKYAYYDGTWHTETVDSGGAGADNSITLDSGGYPHISYFGAGNLKYAYYDGSWHTETVDSGGDVGYYTSIALDSSDNPHISYYDDTNKDLKYAYEVPVGGIWVPVDKLALLAPYIALVSTIILAISASVAYIKYRKKQ